VKPSDLYLPEKFKEFRSKQLETAAKVNTCSKYAFLLDSPTGTGKSIIAATVQRLLKKNIAYVCTTKQLQDQLMHDFPYARTIKGRSNYKCLKYPNMYPDISAEECNHVEAKPCLYHKDCPYMVAKKDARSAPIAVLNTAYFLSEVNFVGMFSGYELLVIDEFDTIEDQLMAFTELVITQRQLQRLEVPPPKYKTKFESWVEWANATLSVTSRELAVLEAASGKEGSWSTEDLRTIRRKRDLSRLVSKLRFFVKEVDKNWIWYPTTDRWSFKPVWVSRYASGVLWKHAKKVLGMSATILDPIQVSANTGLRLENRTYDYLQMPSPFPKENRPVYFEPCANVINKQMDVALPMLAKALQGILDKYPNDRVLVHTVSYMVRDYLIKKIASPRFVTHGTMDRASVLENFKKSTKPLVLISPSMDRGVDLPEQECRAVVICKMPYPNLGDAQVNRRIHASTDGNKWYAHKTISSVIQMSGRAVRSETDQAVTYILDQQFERLFNENRGMFPQWWKESLIM